MESQFNNVNTALDIAGTWAGEPEVCNGYIIILVDIKSTEPCTIIVRQSDNKSNYNFEKTIEYLPLTGGARYQIYRNSLYCYVEVVNTSGNPIPNLIVRTHFLNIGRDPTVFDPMIVAGAVEVLNFPAVQEVSGSVDVNNFPAVQEVNVNNFPTSQVVKGQNNNFEFYPTPDNNTQAIYASDIQGTNTQGGWSYNNTTAGKINWYIYNNSSNPSGDYKVSQMVNLYTVIQNNSTAGASAQNPFIILYTRPDAGTNDAFWYKSKLFFGNNYGADVTGLKLFYTGSDPVGVHPEITGNNRIPLLFNSALSGNKLLANVQNESIMLGSLQTTNNTSPANAYSFVLQQLTIEWVLTPSILPIENGRLLCNVTSPTYLNTATYNQAVSAVSFTGTAYDMGENSLVDVLLYATGTIATGNVRLDFSIDGITWVPNNTTTYSISGTDPHQTIIGLKTGSRYIRVSTGDASAFRADNLQMTFSSKRN